MGVVPFSTAHLRLHAFGKCRCRMVGRGQIEIRKVWLDAAEQGEHSGSFGFLIGAILAELSTFRSPIDGDLAHRL